MADVMWHVRLPPMGEHTRACSVSPPHSLASGGGPEGCLQTQEQRCAAERARGATGKLEVRCGEAQRRVAAVEAEMRALLAAVQRHKSASAAKMAQLASLLQVRVHVWVYSCSWSLAMQVQGHTVQSVLLHCFSSATRARAVVPRQDLQAPLHPALLDTPER